ncbi:NEW3 domain-containing protein [Patescibacteria group bacterium]
MFNKHTFSRGFHVFIMAITVINMSLIGTMIRPAVAESGVLPCPDMNSDGVIDLVDFSMFGIAHNDNHPSGDFDGSGTVDDIDFAMFESVYPSASFSCADWYNSFDQVPACPDMNGDGVVDLIDLSMFSIAQAGSDLSGDFDGNGIVDDVDFAILESLYGKGYSCETRSIVEIIEEPLGPVTIVAHKIVCTDESELPDRHKGGSFIIDANTAQVWVDGHDSCEFAAGWDFQWRINVSTSHPDYNPGDNTGEASGLWSTFGPTDSNGMTMVELDLDQIENDQTETFWFREVWQDGYIPFTGTSNSNHYTAEFYCNNDVKNYDNLEWISRPNADEAYYCVSWNVQETYPVHGYKWHDINGNGERDCESTSINVDEVIEPDCEPKLENWTIEARQETSLVASTQTDVNGNYQFNLPAGTYDICEVQQDSYKQTHPANNNCHTIILPEGESTCLSPQVATISREFVPRQMCNFGNQPDFDVNITKSADSTEVEPDDTVTYTIDWELTGVMNVDEVVVVDTLPAEVAFAGATGTATYDAQKHTVTWTYIGPHTPVVTGSETITVTVSEEVQDGDELLNEVTIFGTVYGEEGVVEEKTLVPANFSVTAAQPTLTIVKQKIASDNALVVVNVPQVLGEVTEPVLEIVKEVGQEFANPGDTVQYTITVANVGEGAALNTMLMDTLPAGFTYSDGKDTQEWELGDLQPGKSTETNYEVTIKSNQTAGTYDNIAVTWADNHDEVQDTASLEIRVPEVLGALADTGIQFKDYLMFVSGLLLVAVGIVLVRPKKLAFRRKKSN